VAIEERALRVIEISTEIKNDEIKIEDVSDVLKSGLQIRKEKAMITNKMKILSEAELISVSGGLRVVSSGQSSQSSRGQAGSYRGQDLFSLSNSSSGDPFADVKSATKNEISP
jgi:hypothetical protein